MDACWEALAGASVDAARAALVEHAPSLGLAGTPSATLLSGTGADHALVIVANHASTSIELALVPTSLIDEPLRQALGVIDRKVFAGAGDLRPGQWDAAVLVMAALQLEMGNAGELARWAADEGSSLSPAQVEAAWGRWSSAWIVDWAGLDRAVSRVYALSRAM